MIYGDGVSGPEATPHTQHVPVDTDSGVLTKIEESTYQPTTNKQPNVTRVDREMDHTSGLFWEGHTCCYATQER